MNFGVKFSISWFMKILDFLQDIKKLQFVARVACPDLTVFIPDKNKLLE